MTTLDIRSRQEPFDLDDLLTLQRKHWEEHGEHPDELRLTQDQGDVLYRLFQQQQQQYAALAPNRAPGKRWHGLRIRVDAKA